VEQYHQAHSDRTHALDVWPKLLARWLYVDWLIRDTLALQQGRRGPYGVGGRLRGIGHPALPPCICPLAMPFADAHSLVIVRTCVMSPIIENGLDDRNFG
jgi:hypothetical protein